MTELATMIRQVGDKFDASAADLGGRLGELEKRFARMGENEYQTVAETNPLAAAIANSDKISAVSSAFRGEAVIKLGGENAAITSANTTVGAGRSPATSLAPSQRLPDIITPYERELRVRDVIGSARTTASAVEYPKETGYTNNAAPVAENTLKPRSDITFDLSNAPVRTIAHTFKISRQMLDDVPALAAYVGMRGTYGLKFVEEQQLLKGNGTGQELLGLLPQATAFAPTWAAQDPTPIDRLLQAISQAEDSEIAVNAIVLNRRDWRRIIGTKDAGGNYIAEQSPFGLQAPLLWNLPVVATNAMTAGTFLTGAFGEGAQIFDRLDTEVLISTENEDDFVKNMATIRVENRLAFAVYRPEAFVSGDLYAA
ncbi:phage major capsid protein [Agrobacterium rosae]|uniref:phage major capsid protein n=1 Tax=Agrobacterium rosae TaxID=1972867 RepID=UPI0019D3B9DD|nr:phage major capsid protein [Agrobacterium rosae]MBN7807267.1 phage major capsid protein [Agrobacterium rosae]